MNQPRNDFWSILVFFCGSVQVFHTKEDPAKDKRIVERASLIIPPNDIVLVKDRFGMFPKRSLTFLTLAQIKASQKSIFELKEDEGHE